MLSVSNLNQYYGGSHILRDLSFEVPDGKVTALLGRNGVGKSTLLRTLMGLVPAAGGAVKFGERDLTRLTEAQIAHAGVGRKFQKPTIFERHSAFENLELAMKADKRVRRTLFAKLSGAERDRIGATLERVGLAASADREGGLLSHGQKQWLEIAMLLMQEPHLLLLDEPVAGMSDEETERTAELFVSLAGEHSLVVVEHDMAFIASIARKVTVLHEGRVIAEGALEAVQADPRVIEVYLGR